LTVGGTQKGDIVKDLMKTCFDNGINMFDNAEAYNAGESEREMGRVIKELNWDRRDVIITTKISSVPSVPTPATPEVSRGSTLLRVLTRV